MNWLLIVLAIIVIIGLVYFLMKQRSKSGISQKPENPEAGAPPDGPAM